MPKPILDLSDKELSEKLLEALNMGRPYYVERLIEIALTAEFLSQRNILASFAVLRDLQRRKIVESDGGVYRLLQTPSKAQSPSFRSRLKSLMT